jgi:predicted nucleotidyltransferase
MKSPNHIRTAPATDTFLRDIVSLIVEFYKPTRVYLFGSRAKGNERADSDFDIVVLVDKKISFSKEREFYKARWDAKLTRPVDIVVWTEKGFRELLEVKTSLPCTVAEEGKLLYEAA